jgi:hypothetical protein
LKKVFNTAYGLPVQLALLPNGELVFTEYRTNAITILKEGSYRRLIPGYTLSPAVATLPNGRIVYSQGSYVNVIDPDTEEVAVLGDVPSGHSVKALVADRVGNVYAATSEGSIFRYEASVPEAVEVIRDLPYGKYQISDMDLSDDGTIYVSGFGKVITISDGAYSILLPNLDDEPVFIEISPNGLLYIDDLSGLQIYDPSTKQSTRLDDIPALNDVVALSNDEIIFYHWKGSYYKYDFRSEEIQPFFLNYGNSDAFAVSENRIAYFAAANIPEVHNATLISVNESGETREHESISFAYIYSVDFDFNQQLCMATDQGFNCYKNDELLRSVQPSRDVFAGYGSAEIASGPNGDWYIIKSNQNENVINVFHMDEAGRIKRLPISFSLSSFDGAYGVDDVSIDVHKDGVLALIVTAIGSQNEGPYYQRVYRAEPNGDNLIEVANLDSDRIAGMVDIAIGEDKDIYVLNVQNHGDPISRIDIEGNVHPFVNICGGHDPKSIDVAANGDVWFSTTTGIFRVFALDENQ